jgi:hypothetical protein
MWSPRTLPSTKASSDRPRTFLGAAFTFGAPVSARAPIVPHPSRRERAHLHRYPQNYQPGAALGAHDQDSHCLLSQFVARAKMKRGAFYRHYLKNPAFAELLSSYKDALGRTWVRISAVETVRSDYASKKPHGNRGRAPTRECRLCDHRGHPRHTRCGGCGAQYDET